MKFLTFLTIFLFISNNAYAYIGIGPLLPLLGSIILYIFLGIISILGFIIYPFRKIQAYFKKKKKEQVKKN
tara:strand:+ start:4620 stop:4832 length:213 start_codon:yes stop_codon:yes gene_type:complete